MMIAYRQKQKAYLAASKKYEDAESAYNNAESIEAVNNWRFNSDDLLHLLDTTYKDWVVNGFKNEVEGMVAYLDLKTGKQ